MYDEVVIYYVDMIDQMLLGYCYFKEQFGIIFCIGWQIDLFGYLVVQVYFFGVEVLFLFCVILGFLCIFVCIGVGVNF